MLNKKQLLKTKKQTTLLMILLIILSMVTGILVPGIIYQAAILILLIVLIFVGVNRITGPLYQNKEIEQINVIQGKLKELAEAAAEVASNGHFKKVVGEINIEKISDSLEILLEKFNSFIKEMDNISEKTLDTSRNLAEVTKNTSETMEDVSATVQELTATAEEVNSSNEEIATGSQNIEQMAHSGLEKMEKMEREMDKIMDGASRSGEKTKNLQAASSKIEGIIKVIANVAKQTNLLALNAAIEAARAGHEGRGFAVVADEVRKLAQDTQDSLGEIDKLIDNLKKETAETVAIIETNREQINAGEEVLQETTENFREITRNIQEIVPEINQSAAASKTISEGAQEIAAATEQQTGVSAEIAGLSGNLSRMASDLKETLATTNIGGFNLEIDLAEFDQKTALINETKINSLKNEIGISYQFVIAVIARLEPMKGHRFLIDSLKELFKKNRKVICLIIGDGSLEGELKQMVAGYGLNDKINFLGYRTDIPEILTISDLVVLTSEKEGQPPRIITEAMAISRAVIATAVTGNKYLIEEGKNGFLVDYGDTEKMVRNIEFFINNQEKVREFGQQGRKRIEKLTGTNER